MSQTINVNGQSISYPETGDTNWGDEATSFAVQTSAALGKIGLASGTSVDITSTLDVTGATTLDSTLTVAGTTTLNGNTNLGNAITDTVTVTAILNVDSGVLYVDPSTNKVGINDTTPSEALDVTGNALISGTLGVTGNSTFTGDVITSIVKASGSGGLTIDSNGGTDVALFGAGGGSGTTLYGGLNGTTATFSGVIYADDDTTANTPVISFTGDTNTGIGRSAADTLDFITNGISRARLNSTGQQSSVIPDLSGSNTNLFNEFKCRAWVNFNGTLSGSITPSGSGNISSITKNAQGDYTIAFLVNFPDINYCITGTCAGSGSSSAYNNYITGSNTATPKTVSSLRFTTSQAGVLFDADNVSIGIFR